MLSRLFFIDLVNQKIYQIKKIINFLNRLIDYYVLKQETELLIPAKKQNYENVHKY